MNLWVEQHNREAREAHERSPLGEREQELRDARDDLTEELLEIARYREEQALCPKCPKCGTESMESGEFHFCDFCGISYQV